jgi:hypothetical protein
MDCLIKRAFFISPQDLGVMELWYIVDVHADGMRLCLLQVMCKYWEPQLNDVDRGKLIL